MKRNKVVRVGDFFLNPGRWRVSSGPSAPSAEQGLRLMHSFARIPQPEVREAVVRLVDWMAQHYGTEH